MSYCIDFISEENFDKHILETVMEYKKTLEVINLKKFNSNIIDPIKLIFDKNVYQEDYKTIIEKEIQRQRDKSNNNYIGYFHQNIFKYIENCTVPATGWDIIYKPKDKSNNTYYVEMKNKHNTMNSSSTAKTYMRFQNHLQIGRASCRERV